MNYQIGKHYRLIVDPIPYDTRWNDQPVHTYDLYRIDQYSSGHLYEQGHGEIPAAALPIGSDRLKTILESAFCIRGHGGYPALFLAAGCEIVCVSCGIAALTDEYADDDTDLEYHVDDACHDRPTGEMCSWCNAWIWEPFCADCGTDASELAEPHRMTGNRLEYSDSREYCVCRQCIHDALLRTREIEYDARNGDDTSDNYTHRTQATVVAPQTYELSNCWYAGVYGKEAQTLCR